MSDLAKLAVKAARKRAGSGWLLLGGELQDALICKELVAIAMMQSPSMLAGEPGFTEFVQACRDAKSEEQE